MKIEKKKQLFFANNEVNEFLKTSIEINPFKGNFFKSFEFTKQFFVVVDGTWRFDARLYT